MLRTALAFFLLGTSSFGAELKLAVGDSLVCLLRPALWAGGQAQTKCWGVGSEFRVVGGELTVPAFPKATAIAASRRTACVLAEGRVRCWGYGKDRDGEDYAALVEQKLAGFTHVTTLAGGVFDFCAIDAVRGELCVQFGGYVTDPANPITGPKFTPAPGRHLLAAGYAFACTLGADQKPVCWETEGNQCSNTDYTKLKRTLVAPRELSVTPASYNRCRACVIDGAEVVCWGGGEAFEKFTAPQGLVSPASLVQLDRKDHGGSEAVPCVIDGGIVKCRADDGAFRAHSKYEGFAKPVALAASAVLHCATNEWTILCHFGDFLEKRTLRLAHGLWVSDFGVAELDRALGQLAQEIYADRASVVRTAAEYLKADVVRRAPFVLFALQPLIEHTDSEFVEKVFRPSWNKLRAAAAAPSPEPASRIAALRLLAAAAPGLRKACPKADWNAFVAVVGEALARGADAPAVAAVKRAHAALDFSAIEPRGIAFERLLALLVGWLG